jgi:hypothetical protein
MKPFNTNDGDSADLVKVRIKSPSAHYSDLLLICERELSVRGLKGLIETSYPAAPPPADQKLVYAGKLLSDELRLEQFLRFEDDCSVFTIHLVCRIPEQAVRKASDADAAAAIGVDGIRHRTTAASSVTAASATTEIVDRPAEVTATISEVLSAEARELARIQELLQGLAAAPAAAATEEAELRSMEAVYRQYVHLYSQHMLHVQQEAAAERQRPRHHQQNDHQLVPHFEGGAAAVLAAEEEGGINNNNNNNDLLDRVYAITRILLLFSVIYFHSSFFRLLFVAVVAFLAHRFQNNLAPRPQNNNNNNNMRAQNNNNNNNEVNLRQGDNRNADNGAVNAEANVGGDLNTEGEEGEGEEQEDKPNVLVVAFTFISSFLSSIIPGYNPPPL